MGRRKEMLRSPNRRGEWAELEFMSRAMLEGLLVSVPWGLRRYDIGVEYRKRRFRVQVKSSWRALRGMKFFRFRLGGDRKRHYTVGEIDFLAVYLISVDLWYIIPARKLRIGNKYTKHIQMTPGKVECRWHAYEEQWDLLRGARDKSGEQKTMKPKEAGPGPNPGGAKQSNLRRGEE